MGLSPHFLLEILWLSSCLKVSFCQDGMSLHRAFSSTQSGKTRAPDGKVCPSLPMIGNFLLYMHLWSVFWFWLMWWGETWQLYNINKYCQRHNGPKALSTLTIFNTFREDINSKATFSFGYWPNKGVGWGWGSDRAQIFQPFFKKCIFGLFFPSDWLIKTKQWSDLGRKKLVLQLWLLCLLYMTVFSGWLTISYSRLGTTRTKWLNVSKCKIQGLFLLIINLL